MTEYEILGVKMVDFEDKQGKPIKGASLYIVSKDKSVIGMKAQKIWLNEDICDMLDFDLTKSVNQKLHVFFNVYGKVADIQLIA